MPDRNPSAEQIDDILVAREDAANLLPEALQSKYEYLGELGAGGMARVFKARNRLSTQVVAIKILHDHTEKALLRFRQEAVTASKLQHPNIVSLLDFGIAHDTAYLVMEYVEGRTLSEIVKSEGPLSIERFKHIAVDLCDALTHAHWQGVIHRDIKPSNVLISTQNGREVAKLADFGIAKIVGEEVAQSLTQTGEVMGTPYYMSPEQCAGQVPGQPSDVYSLGCVLYESLTGAPPLIGENFLETVHRRTQEKAESMRKRHRNIPASIDKAILWCLEADPSFRCPNGTALKDAIFRKHIARRPLPMTKIARTAIGLAAALFMLLGVVAACFIWQAHVDQVDLPNDEPTIWAKAEEFRLKGSRSSARRAYDKLLYLAQKHNEPEWKGYAHLGQAQLESTLKSQRNFALMVTDFDAAASEFARMPHNGQIMAAYAKTQAAATYLKRKNYDLAEQALSEGQALLQQIKKRDKLYWDIAYQFLGTYQSAVLEQKQPVQLIYTMADKLGFEASPGTSPKPRLSP